MKTILRLNNHFTNQTYQIKIPSIERMSLYLCGPTVYGSLHIGNFRNVFLFDLLYRFLLRNKQKVTYWQNITDIDDKIIAVALQQKTTETVITEKYLQEYQTITQQCNILKPQQLKVTDHITELIDFVAKLLKSGHAYQTTSGIYLAISKLKTYNVLRDFNHFENINPENNRFQADKRDKRDFVLWKFTNSGLNWKTPWKNGRPGWHTECVALINQHNNGKTITIHGGGRDLIFPHHENEIAQFSAMHHRNLAHFWMHNGLVTTGVGKISRSAKPPAKLQMKLMLQNYDHNVLRLFYFSQPYYKDLLYSEQKMRDFKMIWLRWQRLLITIQRLVTLNKSSSRWYLKKPSLIQFQFIEKMLANNLSVDKIFPKLFAWEKIINTKINQKLSLKTILKFATVFYYTLKSLGFTPQIPRWTTHQKRWLELWKSAQINKDFIKADKYRQKLQKANLWI